MKTLFNSLTILLLTACVFLSSCQKEELADSLNNNSITASTELDNIPHISNPFDLSDHLMNSEDLSDEEMNQKLLNIALASRPLFTDNAYNQLLIEEAKKHNNNSVSIQQVVRSLESEMAAKDLSVLRSLEEVLENNQLTYQPQSGKDDESLQIYDPAFFVVNAETADYSKLPILATGFSINDELPGMEGYEDYIIAWYVLSDGSFQEILISEETAMTTSNPIFIVDNASFKTPEAPTGKVNVPSDENPFDQERAGKTFADESCQEKVIDKYKILYRYDNSSRSEYSYKLVYWLSNTSYQYGGYRKEIDEIHKNDIGDMFYNDFEIWEVGYMTCNNSSLEGVGIATFEYDWFASNKSVWTPGGIYLSCKMKYLNDYYQRFYIDLDDSTTSSSAKGYIKVKNG